MAGTGRDRQHAVAGDERAARDDPGAVDAVDPGHERSPGDADDDCSPVAGLRGWSLDDCSPVDGPRGWSLDDCRLARRRATRDILAGRADGGAGYPVDPAPASAPLGTESIPLPPKSAPGTPGGLAATPPPNAAWSAAQTRSEARQARHEAREARRAARGDRRGALFFGIVLILIGGYFFVRTYFPAVDTDQLWPIIAIAIGLLLIVGAFRRGPAPPA